MAVQKRRKYSREEKLEIIRLMETDPRSQTELAADLGIHENTLYKWRRALSERGEKAFPGNGVRHEPLTDLEAAQREIARLRQQLDERDQDCRVLKKALRIVSDR